MRFNEKVLLFESRGDSPLVRAKNIVSASMVRGTAGDSVHLEVIPDDGPPATHHMQFNEAVAVQLQEGFVKATRMSGDGPVTVLLYMA